MTIEEIFKAIRAGGSQANKAFEEFYGTIGKDGEPISTELRITMAKFINKRFSVHDDKVIEIIIEDTVFEIFESAPKLKNLDGINGWFWMTLRSKAIDYFRREGTQKNNKRPKKNEIDIALQKYESYKKQRKQYNSKDRELINKLIEELEDVNELDSSRFKKLMIIKDEIDIQFIDQDYRLLDIKEIDSNEISLVEDDEGSNEISEISGELKWVKNNLIDDEDIKNTDLSFAKLNPKSSDYLKQQIESEFIDCMRKGLAKLEKEKPEHATVLNMRFIEGNSIDEIKDKIGRTANATKTFIHSCLKTDMSYFEECR
jgi:DNA-directed RNA polymerase specialized sigma24 family protein